MEHCSYTHASNVSATGDQHPVAAALRAQEWFNRAQVAWLMSQAMRWGYESRVDEENANWPDTTLRFNGTDTINAADRTRLRDEIDASARLARPGDHCGGAVAWDETTMQVAA